MLLSKFWRNDGEHLYFGAVSVLWFWLDTWKLAKSLLFFFFFFLSLFLFLFLFFFFGGGEFFVFLTYNTFVWRWFSRTDLIRTNCHLKIVTTQGQAEYPLTWLEPSKPTLVGSQFSSICYLYHLQVNYIPDAYISIWNYQLIGAGGRIYASII